MNHHPLHINDVYAANPSRAATSSWARSSTRWRSACRSATSAARRSPTSPPKSSSTRRPVFHGDTLFCESEVLEKRESQSKPDRGTVKVHTRVLNQDGVLVAEFKRLVLVPAQDPGAGAARGRENVR